MPPTDRTVKRHWLIFLCLIQFFYFYKDGNITSLVVVVLVVVAS